MENWKANNPSHFSTPPTATGSLQNLPRYTNNLPGTKDRVGQLDKQIRIASVAHTLLGKVVEGANGDRILGALYGDMASSTRAVHRVPDAALAVVAGAERG